MAAPPWTSLRDLEYAVEQYEQNAEELDEASLKWINQLIAPGSSLGGARPKADVVDTNGKRWIAKFPNYLLSDKRAAEIKDEVMKAVSKWREIAAKYKVSSSEIERKGRAFL